MLIVDSEASDTNQEFEEGGEDSLFEFSGDEEESFIDYQRASSSSSSAEPKRHFDLKELGSTLASLFKSVFSSSSSSFFFFVERIPSSCFCSPPRSKTPVA